MTVLVSEGGGVEWMGSGRGVRRTNFLVVQSKGIKYSGKGVVGRRGSMKPLARRKRVQPVIRFEPIQTPNSALGSALAAVWCVQVREWRLSACCVTIHQVPNGKGRRVGLELRISSSGVDGELRVLMRVLRVAAMAL